MKSASSTANTNHTPPPNSYQANTDPLHPWAWVQTVTSLSRTTVWRQIRAGAFPAPIKISPGRVAWRESDVVAWLNARTERTCDAGSE